VSLTEQKHLSRNGFIFLSVHFAACVKVWMHLRSLENTHEARVADSAMACCVVGEGPFTPLFCCGFSLNSRGIN